ncbi:hypothetical protein Bhyg_00851 [Pseudolycoriella hygida]|uniref:Chitin-binding type-2 domain-containing protein n=1 Tax=Pseudolycoriella hygida TaxID=35572 RepID=A0A9Q0N8M7_9DIPT|nr:hypothetical protein Bhyg_00851 [Pseudolycoriella hygida]
MQLNSSSNNIKRHVVTFVKLVKPNYFLQLKMIVLIGLLSCLVITCQADVSIPGLPIKSLLPRAVSTKAVTSCKNIYGPVCGDCNTLWICLGGETAYQKQTCGTIYPGQPYCVDGACTSFATPTVECPLKGGITCTGKGYFPNPLNCSQYVFCEKAEGNLVVYECPNGFVYNSLTKGCKRKVLPADCGTINCASTPNQFAAYPPDASFYALCEGSTKPTVFKCPDSELFVPSLRRCVFQCKKEGRFVDGRDCSKYYECYRNGLSYILLHQTCLSKFIFNAETNGCEAEN